MQIAQVSSRELINLRYDRFREHSRNISIGGSADRQHASAADALDAKRTAGKKLVIKQRRPSPLLKSYASKKHSLLESSRKDAQEQADPEDPAREERKREYIEITDCSAPGRTPVEVVLPHAFSNARIGAAVAKEVAATPQPVPLKQKHELIGTKSPSEDISEVTSAATESPKKS